MQHIKTEYNGSEKVNEGEEDERIEYRNVKREVQSSDVVVFDIIVFIL